MRGRENLFNFPSYSIDKDKTLLLEFMPDNYIGTLSAEAQTLFEVVEEEIRDYLLNLKAVFYGAGTVPYNLLPARF